MTPDFRIELSRFPDRARAWEWITYDPRDVESTLHHGRAALRNPGRRAEGRRGVTWQTARQMTGGNKERFYNLEGEHHRRRWCCLLLKPTFPLGAELFA
jgi:hypothetical protein